MAEDHGLGALQSPPDERDYDIAAAYELAGATPPVSLARIYTVDGMPPVSNQGNTPRCVAFSTAGTKNWQDKKDQKKFFDFDEAHFFRDIGGTSQGAYLRTAMDRMLRVGYPVVSWLSPNERWHRIRAYYAVPKTTLSIKQAVATFGPLNVASPWYNSWMHPVTGMLPAADYAIGGHAYVITGWDDSRGGGAFRCRNSWGTSWGLGGDFYIKYSVFTSRAYEVWKSLDVID